MTELEEAQQYFTNDRFATLNGAVIEAVGDNYARVGLTVNERHMNAVGGVMGGVYFMLADFAFAVATNRNGMQTVSLTSDTSFLSPPKDKRMYAETELIRMGKTTCCFNVSVRDGLDRPLAAVKIVGYILKS